MLGDEEGWRCRCVDMLGSLASVGVSWTEKGLGLWDSRLLCEIFGWTSRMRKSFRSSSLLSLGFSSPL